MNHLRPLDDRVLIQRDDPEEKSSGGIFIPDTAQKKPSEGVVLAVGPGRWGFPPREREREPMTVKVGDRVLFQKYAGQDNINDYDRTLAKKSDQVLMREGEIIAVLEAADG